MLSTLFQSLLALILWNLFKFVDEVGARTHKKSGVTESQSEYFSVIFLDRDSVTQLSL